MRALAIFAILVSGNLMANADQTEGNAFNGCVEIQVEGVRTPSFSCLTQKLNPSRTQRQPGSAALTTGNTVYRPGNQIGLFNQSATSHRMGKNFGTSVLPQRPNAPQTSPLIPSH